VLIVVELGSVAMHDQKEANIRRYLGTILGSIGPLSNVLFFVFEDVMIVCARICWIV
jgi:hypothetical protein